MNAFVPKIDGVLRKHSLRVPEAISECSGIIILGKHIRSLVFSTDISIICNVNADAVLAVYPFTPQTRITRSILSAADIPVFCGVGGGITTGDRVVLNAVTAESLGTLGVVVNSPTSNDVIRRIVEKIEIPVIATVVSEAEDFEARIDAGVGIFNVSAAAKTPDVVRLIRSRHPQFPIIATGGPSEETVKAAVAAGANAITWTPPTTGELMHTLMSSYREQRSEKK